MYSEVAGGEQGGGGDSWLGRGLLCSCPHSALCLMLGLCICRVSVSTTNAPRLFYKFYLCDDLPKFPGKSWTFGPSALASRGTRIAGLHSQTQLYQCLCPRPVGQACRLLQFNTVGSNQTSLTDVDNPCSPDIEPMCYSCSGQNLLKTLELTAEELKLGIQGGQLRGLEEERRNRLEPHWLPAEHCQIGRFPRQSCQDWALQPEEQPSPRLLTLRTVEFRVYHVVQTRICLSRLYPPFLVSAISHKQMNEWMLLLEVTGWSKRDSPLGTGWSWAVQPHRCESPCWDSRDLHSGLGLSDALRSDC